MNITKEQFLEAYNSYPPNFWIKFIYKYFSEGRKKEDSWFATAFVIIETVLFFSGMLGSILKWDYNIMVTIVFIFGALLFFVVFGGTIAVIMNNLRIKKIRKKLGGIDDVEYNILAEEYLN